MKSDTDTIAAIATAMSSSGIGIVRISGPDALPVLSRIFRPGKKQLDIKNIASHTVTYGHIYDGEIMVDEVLAIYMKAPRSYTAEDTVEVHCHGGVLVVKRVLETVLKHGVRPAEAGEFTKRAFLNGRIDLSQAEAVMELIEAKNEYARESSLRQLGGSVSKKIHGLRKKILYETAFIEAALDDPEHISLDGYRERLSFIMKEIESEVNTLISSADNGRMVSEGIKTVILGKPNAGKSSVLNILLGEERAIVTEVAGTTRDILEEHLLLNGISLNLIDTAGIRHTEDIVEKIGVERAVEHARGADLILYVVDSSVGLSKEDREIMDMIKEKKVVILFNKSDLEESMETEEIKQFTGKTVISFSAKEGTGLSELSDAISQMFFSGMVDFNDEIYITSARQKNALMQALKSIERVKAGIENDMPEDFYTIDLMDAYEYLGFITGETLREELADEIFGKFCMGK